MRRWVDAFPGRLETELEAFSRDERLNFELDEHELAQSGRVLLRGTLERNGEKVELQVVYPDAYPYLRPEVFAPGLELSRHQNPHNHNLCLLDRSTRAWNTDDLGAWLVSERVPYLLDALAEGPEAIAAIEAAQGEPVSVYFGGMQGTAIFIPDDFLGLPADLRTGRARLGVAEGEEGTAVRACLLAVSRLDRKGKEQSVAATEDQRLHRRFPRTALDASWARLEQLPLGGEGTPQEILEAAHRVNGFQRPSWNRVPGGKLRITGVLFTEEVRQEEFEDDWLFVVEAELENGSEGLYFVNTERLSPVDLRERVPRLSGLAERGVGLVGLGAVGAPIAMELARGQLGQLNVLDSDILEAGNIVRWPRGIHAVGNLKTVLIEAMVASDYPFTETVRVDHHLGRVGAQPLGDGEALDRLLDGVDLLIDASAEIGVQQYVAAGAVQAGIPQIFAWATEGGLGGAVARVVPGETGCWYCLQLHLADGTIPLPPAEEAGTVQPRGCASPTFTGSSIDILPVSVQAARVASSQLLSGRDADADDVFICDQVPTGNRFLSAPRWSSFTLEPHPNCDCSAAGA